MQPLEHYCLVYLDDSDMRLVGTLRDLDGLPDEVPIATNTATPAASTAHSAAATAAGAPCSATSSSSTATRWMHRRRKPGRHEARSGS